MPRYVKNKFSIHEIVKEKEIHTSVVAPRTAKVLSIVRSKCLNAGIPHFLCLTLFYFADTEFLSTSRQCPPSAKGTQLTEGPDASWYFLAIKYF